MKKLNFLLIFFALALAATGLKAQDGLYLEPQYEVEVETDVVYGVNATILPVLFQQSEEALPRPLTMDVYQPVDAPGDRPVMLVFHTGNFLPFPFNNGTGGTKEDSTVVELCNRLAQRGYVAASVDYRLGWNPADPSQDFRKFFLINAAYRGVQDARTAVRFMRLIAEDGNAQGEINPYQIDPEKIGIWGVGTGGYIVAPTATLDSYQEIVIPKFLIDLGSGNPVPMVIEAINGNINGTSVGIVPPDYPVLPVGDTLCYPNHVTYANGDPISSDISFAVNNGGALGDISWLDENTPPWVSFHVPTDPFAPYTTGVLTVPGTGEDPDDPSDDFAVVEVSGSYDIQTQMNFFGNNDLFEMLDPALLDYDEVADSRNDGNEGLFPFPTGDEPDSAPWDFFAADNPNYDPEVDVLLDPVRARMYWDTVMAYTGVRACLAMELGCNLTSLNTISETEVNLLAAPNPSVDEIQISVDPDYTIQAMELYDVGGRLMRTYFDVNNHQHTVYRNELTAGIYYLRVRLEEGVVFQKLIFN